jgi:uncharacterized protein DUF4167
VLLAKSGKILAATQTDFSPDGFRSSNPTTPASQSVSIASQRTVAQKPRGTAWFRGGKEDFKKAWISIEWMNGCLNNSTKDAARALPDTTFGCGNPPSTTAVLPRADLGFTCRRKSLGTDQALRSSDQDVAAQREHAAGSDGCAVDRGDDRLFAFHDGVEALSDDYQKSNVSTRRSGPTVSGHAQRWVSNAPAETRSAQRNYERYLALARAEAQNGNTVAAENYYQHAEHYFRSMSSDRAK